ncbi:acyl-CoA dehydrogenase [Mycobacterium sp. CBMA 213]|uniref:acyl-CoA dehydrogenase family protein n=1 Tax=Mycolicibacterium sp. CBMA 213 TaxID=1968788 RepID=UPI0012DE2B66|nr:acyl-CoA dehydrogenase family protein [Mycolicibacterium sp. CBMA 213]MUM08990.1 acyl-CoA dehydrogenase [Mycolicibacterium sp. CBMA 213]
MSIDFTLTAEQRKLQQAARDFARSVLADVPAAIRFVPTPQDRLLATKPMYEQLVAEGWLRKILPAPVGGESNGMVDAALVAEEFYAVDADVSLTAFAVVLGLLPVLHGGSPAQVQAAVAPFLTGTGAPLAAFCHSEPGGIANFAEPAPAEGVRTTAVLDGDEWVINGTKQWISNATGWDGTGVDLTTVVCRTAQDPATAPENAFSVIVVPKQESGIVLEEAFDTLGHRGHLTPRFRFDNVRVPRENVVGEVGGGKALVEASFASPAALVGAFGVGLARAAFDAALTFARTEKRAGSVPIIEHQAVGYALADAKTSIEAARYLNWKACHALDNQLPSALELAVQAKIFGSETAVRVITDLMRVVGIDSYNHDLPLARLLQDAVVLPLFDGGNMGVRRRQLHDLLKSPGYNSMSTVES